MLERATPIRVLLVEDNPYDAKIVTELFRDIKTGGFALTVAETLEKAAAAGGQGALDVVLLDLNLPDSFGPATLKRAVTLFPGRPIIVMTGFYEEHLGIELIKEGAQDYLVKGKITGDWLAYSIKYAIERAKIEGKLKMREGRLRAILEKSPDGFLVVRRDGVVLFANPGSERIFGRTRESLLKAPFTLEADTEKIIETELTRPDGKKLPLEIRAVEIAWDAEICRLVILRNLAPVRALERSRDEFISMISHELRAPLTVVKESMQLFYDGAVGPPTEKQKEIIKLGLDNAARLNRLIDALLDITKIEAGVMPMDISRTDLVAMLAETAKDFALSASEKKITLAALPGSPVQTYCDAEKIREIVINLVSNALKFTPDGGRITLSAKYIERDAHICVENSGPGIPEEDLPKLFNKFAQLNRSVPTAVKGTGLGLAICKGFAEMHKGRIWAESRPEYGTRFCVKLPLLDFDGSAREMVRREIELAGGEQRHFSAVTLTLPEKLLRSADGIPEKMEAFLKTYMRNIRVILKREAGDYTLLFPNSDARTGCKAASLIEMNLAKIAGVERGPETELTSLLSYPEDFSDENSFILKLAAERGKVHA
ncbi:MAG TPA: ATP-binding protein [Elusimicrobiales bacterium]|nr:ATP-binding protein [Elusimicrobiales bacterium]